MKEESTLAAYDTDYCFICGARIRSKSSFTLDSSGMVLRAHVNCDPAGYLDREPVVVSERAGTALITFV
jgi:hypothetical protein